MFSSRVGMRAAFWSELVLASLNNLENNAFNTAIVAAILVSGCQDKETFPSFSVSCYKNNHSLLRAQISHFAQHKRLLNHSNWQTLFLVDVTITFHALVCRIILVIPLFTITHNLLTNKSRTSSEDFAVAEQRFTHSASQCCYQPCDNKNSTAWK